MKTRSYLLLTLLLLVSMGGFSQETDTDQWKETLSRHEFQFNFGDPHIANTYSQLYTNRFQSDGATPSSSSSWTEPGGSYNTIRIYPVFSFSYYFRFNKYFWFGATTVNSFVTSTERDILSNEIIDRDYNLFLLKTMPGFRISYLNRKNVTLYSGASGGISFYIKNKFIYSKLFYQLTAFGVKAGGDHWFGDIELGYGFKGYVSAGFGYQL